MLDKAAILILRLSPYLIIGLIIIGVILRARAGYVESKLWKYIRKNCPEKEREFGCVKRGLLNEFALISALRKEDDIKDAEFIRLKTQTRYAWMCMLVFMGVIVGILVLSSLVLVISRL